MHWNVTNNAQEMLLEDSLQVKYESERDQEHISENMGIESDIISLNHDSEYLVKM